MLGRPLLFATLAVVTFSCSKPDSGSGAATTAPSSPGAGTPVTSTATSTTNDGGSSLASGFEGAIVMHTTGVGGPHDMLFFTKGGKLRVEIPGPSGSAGHSIFDPATSKTFLVMDSQHMVMERPVPALPPHSPGAPTITRTGKHETVAGYDCEDWDVSPTDGIHDSVCVAPGITFFDFTGIAVTRPGAPSWADELRASNEFPLRAVRTDASGKEISRMEVTRIDKRALIDDTFVIPRGYDVVPTESQGRGAGAGRAPAPR